VHFSCSELLESAVPKFRNCLYPQSTREPVFKTEPLQFLQLKCRFTPSIIVKLLPRRNRSNSRASHYANIGQHTQIHPVHTTAYARIRNNQPRPQDFKLRRTSTVSLERARRDLLDLIIPKQSASIITMDSFPFLALPPELRIMVYRHLLPTDNKFQVYSGLCLTCGTMQREFDYEALLIVRNHY
jgi:hypothetical protein